MRDHGPRRWSHCYGRDRGVRDGWPLDCGGLPDPRDDITYRFPVGRFPGEPDQQSDDNDFEEGSHYSGARVA